MNVSLRPLYLIFWQVLGRSYGQRPASRRRPSCWPRTGPAGRRGHRSSARRCARPLVGPDPAARLHSSVYQNPPAAAITYPPAAAGAAAPTSWPTCTVRNGSRRPSWLTRGGVHLTRQDVDPQQLGPVSVPPRPLGEQPAASRAAPRGLRRPPGSARAGAGGHDRLISTITLMSFPERCSPACTCPRLTRRVISCASQPRSAAASTFAAR
jgi:hypothetical protein